MPPGGKHLDMRDEIGVRALQLLDEVMHRVARVRAQHERDREGSPPTRASRRIKKHSEALRRTRAHSDALVRTRAHSYALVRTRAHSDTLRSTPRHSEAIRSHQKDGAHERARCSRLICCSRRSRAPSREPGWPAAARSSRMTRRRRPPVGGAGAALEPPEAAGGCTGCTHSDSVRSESRRKVAKAAARGCSGWRCSAAGRGEAAFRNSVRSTAG